jgi:hypothetical protein
MHLIPYGYPGKSNGRAVQISQDIDMNVENKSLLSCLRNDLTVKKIKNLKSLQEDDWDKMLQASARFGTTPLLHLSLKPLFSDLNVPAEIKKQLQEIYYLAAVRNTSLYQHLSNLITLFNREEIPVILLKGAHLAEFVYGNLALRPMSDVDLLVRKEDLSRVIRSLMEQGYRASKEDIGASEDHLTPFKKENSLKIDVHFNILRPPFSERFAVADLWARAQVRSLQGIEVRTLCPEDLLFHLCAHAALYHGFSNGIMPFMDISRTIEHYQAELDWDQLLIRCRQWGLSRCLYLMLALTEKLVGLSVPEHILSAIRPDDDGDTIASAEELLFGKVMPVTPNISRLFSHEKWPDKWRLFVRRAFPREETMFFQEPMTRNSLSYYLMYLSRIRSISKRHGKTVFRALVKDKDTCASMALENKRNAIIDWLKS